MLVTVQGYNKGDSDNPVEYMRVIRIRPDLEQHAMRYLEALPHEVLLSDATRNIDVATVVFHERFTTFMSRIHEAVDAILDASDISKVVRDGNNNIPLPASTLPSAADLDAVEAERELKCSVKSVS